MVESYGFSLQGLRTLAMPPAAQGSALRTRKGFHPLTLCNMSGKVVGYIHSCAEGTLIESACRILAETVHNTHCKSYNACKFKKPIKLFPTIFCTISRPEGTHRFAKQTIIRQRRQSPRPLGVCAKGTLIESDFRRILTIISPHRGRLHSEALHSFICEANFIRQKASYCAFASLVLYYLKSMNFLCPRALI